MCTGIPLILLRQNPKLIWDYLNYVYGYESSRTKNEDDEKQSTHTLSQEEVNTERSDDTVPSNSSKVSLTRDPEKYLNPDQIFLLGLLLSYSRKIMETIV